MVAIRGDTYLAGSLFEMLRLQRVSQNEGEGCLELAAFLENGLILQGLAT